MHNFSTLFW